MHILARETLVTVNTRADVYPKWCHLCWGICQGAQGVAVYPSTLVRPGEVLCWLNSPIFGFSETILARSGKVATDHASDEPSIGP